MCSPIIHYRKQIDFVTKAVDSRVDPVIKAQLHSYLMRPNTTNGVHTAPTNISFLWGVGNKEIQSSATSLSYDIL